MDNVEFGVWLIGALALAGLLALLGIRGSRVRDWTPLWRGASVVGFVTLVVLVTSVCVRLAQTGLGLNAGVVTGLLAALALGWTTSHVETLVRDSRELHRRKAEEQAKLRAALAETELFLKQAPKPAPKKGTVKFPDGVRPERQ